jgi:hypothetical protein
MRILKSILALSVIVLATARLSGVAEATPSTIKWTSVATSCVPDPTTIAEGKAEYVSSAGVQFASGESGTLTYYCPVTGALWQTSSTDYPNSLLLSYYDGDVSTNHCSVSATFLAKGIFNQSGATISTCSSSNHGTTRSTCTSGFTHTFDFDDSYYWIKLVITRDDTSTTCMAIGAGLENI